MGLPKKAESLTTLSLASPDTFAWYASGGRWTPYPYLKFIANTLAKAALEGNGRVIVSMPPRHGKSELISHWLPVWYLNLFPERRVILTSYGDRLARFFGRRVKNEMLMNRAVSAKVRGDSKAADEMETLEGGGMYTSGMGGAITGRGAELIVIDDPIKTLKDAMSQIVRENQIEWFRNVLYTRLEPGGSIFLVLTRWHEMDLAGWILSAHSDRWQVINIPAISEDNDPIGRAPGQPLCPQRFSLNALLQIKESVGSRAWASLYQGRPAPQEGAILKRTWFQRWSTLPETFDMMIQSWDTTIKEAGSSYVVGQIWGRKDKAKYLLDQVRGKWGFGELLTKFRQLSAKWPAAGRKLIEAKANGPAIEDQLKRDIGGITLVEPSGTKEVRAMAVEPDLEAGHVFVPSDEVAYPWVQGFLEECVTFPNGENDDQVDAATQALNWLRTKGVVVYGGKDRNKRR